MELDEFDRRLLTALQQDARRTGEQLAAIVGLSPAACLRRAQRLRETGIIEREIAVVAPKAVGRRLMMLVTVVLEGEQTADEFKRQVRRAPEVLECYHVTGPTDYILVTATADMEEYQEFTKRVLIGNVKRFESTLVIDRVKFETTQPIAE
jgi:Lrp/AsnC family leucine-responsive transcriptional regulator